MLRGLPNVGGGVPVGTEARAGLSDTAEPPLAHGPGLRFLDGVAFVNGFVGPLTSLPQLHMIITTHQTAGVSLLTWWLFVASAALWLVYSVVHRAWPVMISAVLSIVV